MTNGNCTYHQLGLFYLKGKGRADRKILIVKRKEASERKIHKGVSEKHFVMEQKLEIVN